MYRFIVSIVVMLAAAGLAAAEFVSELRGYAVEVPDGWFEVTPAGVAALRADPEAARRLGVEADYLPELERIAADPGVDYFVLRFSEAYSDNVNVTALRDQPLPYVPEEAMADGKEAFRQAYSAAFGMPVEVTELANVEVGAGGKRFPALKLAMRCEKLNLGMLQYMVELAGGEILYFSLNAGLDGFEEAKGRLPEMLATLRRTGEEPVAGDDNEG